MTEFEKLNSLLASIVKHEDFNVDLSSSPLSDKEKSRLVDKIKEMQCKFPQDGNGRISYFSLGKAAFADVDMANKIYISTIKGNTLTEFINNINIDSEKWEKNCVVNFIFKGDPNDKENPTVKEITKLYDNVERFGKSSKFAWGLVIDKHMSDRYCLEVLTYN